MESTNKSGPMWDNFFYMCTSMENPKNLNDCYFYYYSKCTKGDSCTFRHEPSALGCETVCSFWKEGKCMNVRCSFRHMELRKNRKAIQCYWEQQPGGCLKPHCPFNHLNPKSAKSDEEPDSPNIKNALVVNLEEESDDSTPNCSPEKTKKKSKAKTEEEKELERIQQEDSAQYYSHYAPYITEDVEMPPTDPDLRDMLLKKTIKSQQSTIPSLPDDPKEQEIRELRKRKFAQNLETTGERKRLRLQNKEAPKETDLNNIVIKTLSEIYAERTNKKQNSESEVSSTSSDVLPRVEMEKKSKVRLIRLKKMENNEAILEKQSEASKLINFAGTASTNLTFNESKSEDILLLDDDDEMQNDSLKDEDDIFKNIDELLGD